MPKLLSYRGFLCALLTFVCAFSFATDAQAAPFVNLNFEQANLPAGTPTGFLPASQAFPGWTPRIGDAALNSVHYNQAGLGEGAVILYDTALAIGGFPVHEGRFSVALATDVAFNLPASLSQVGDVPLDSRSLRLLGPRLRPAPIVTLNDMVLPLVILSAPVGPNDPYVYGADITPFAGISAELVVQSELLPAGRYGGVDGIAFSSIPIPEPQTLIIIPLAIGILSRARLQISRKERACRNNPFVPGPSGRE